MGVCVCVRASERKFFAFIFLTSYARVFSLSFFLLAVLLPSITSFVVDVVLVDFSALFLAY